MTRKIPLSEPVFSGNEWNYVKDCLDSGWVSSSGPYVDRFEKNFSEYLNIPHAVSTVNGTSAIHTALLVLGLKSSDLVLVPSLTFVGTVNPVLYCGATPVLIDSESLTFNLDPQRVKEEIGHLKKKKKIAKALIVVHLYGCPADMGPLIDLCQEHDLFLIEDATEALGAQYRGEPAGTLGDIGCFSFNGNKLITTGGGGMLVTRNADYARKARYLTTQARDDAEEYIHNHVGYNYRLTNLQAALGLAQLEDIERSLRHKREIADCYRAGLNGVPGIRFRQSDPAIKDAEWLNCLLVDESLFGMSNRALRDHLGKLGIQTRLFFCPLHLLPPYQKFRTGRMEVSEKLYAAGLNIPSSVTLSDSDVETVIHHIRQLGKQKSIRQKSPARSRMSSTYKIA